MCRVWFEYMQGRAGNQGPKGRPGTPGTEVRMFRNVFILVYYEISTWSSQHV